MRCICLHIIRADIQPMDSAQQVMKQKLDFSAPDAENCIELNGMKSELKILCG